VAVATLQFDISGQVGWDCQRHTAIAGLHFPA
jgi:hypothetical protein